ncbi:unnamed protein product, partial [Cylicostephanus goldi]
MGALLHYAIGGTFITTALIMGVVCMVVYNVISDINSFQDEIEKDLDQFKNFADDAWKTIMAAQPPRQKRASQTTKKRASYSEGAGAVGAGGGSWGGSSSSGGGWSGSSGGSSGWSGISGGGGGGDECQCAAQASGCPRGPPGPPGLPGHPGED